jgi:thiamine pyrophosphate-dependent acetolactate synthase large subunit-like protein
VAPEKHHGASICSTRCTAAKKIFQAADRSQALPDSPLLHREARTIGACPQSNGVEMTALVGDFIIQRLAEWGVHRIYGYPGDGINGLMGALGRPAQVRHVIDRAMRIAISKRSVTCVIVPNDLQELETDLNQVNRKQRVMEGDPRYDASQEVFDFPSARYAELIGLKGIRVDARGQIGVAWDAALRADRPCVSEAITDPEVPPRLPHITFKQARAFAHSMFEGDSGTRGMLRESSREAMATLFPGGDKDRSD